MVDFGVLMFPTEYSIDPVTLAIAAEARGFESLFFPEHTHIPAARRSPWPGGRALPTEYSNTFDPLIAIAGAAAATSMIKLGTGITLITEHDPILMAKQIATLDRMSNGRVLLGVGAGWNGEEMENHGVAFADRWQVLRERILAMQTIWREDEPEFHGKFVDFDRMWANPKPMTPQGPPILLGASSKYTFKRIAEYGDGWFPIHQDEARAAASGAVDYQACMVGIQDAWTLANRSGAPSFSIFGVGPKHSRVDELVEMGFHRVIFALPSADADTVMPMLDKYAEIGHQING